MKKRLLDRIDVKAPCSENWEEMTGNDSVRFCSHCSKDVYDISTMTRAKAEKFVRDSNGRLCVRYVKDARGKVVTAPTRLTPIKRQATVAAGVLAASISLSVSSHAQTQPQAPQGVTRATEAAKSKLAESATTFSLSGTVTDSLGSVVPGAKVVLNSKEGYIKDQKNTGENGDFRFSNLNIGQYEIVITSSGFKKTVVTEIDIRTNFDFPKPLVLETSEHTVGVVSILEDVVSIDTEISGLTGLIASRPLETVRPGNKIVKKKKKNKLPK